MDRPDLGAPDLRIHYVRVTNNLDVPFTDRWDGIPVSIAPGKSDNLQLDMAAHFFGYGYNVPEDVMFRHVCKRQGWNTIDHLKVGDDGKTLAQQKFAKLQIVPVIYKMVEVKPDLDQPIPADPQPPVVPSNGGGYDTPPPLTVTVDKPPVDPDELPPLPKRKTGAH
jgi:hypothetical protein